MRTHTLTFTVTAAWFGRIISGLAAAIVLCFALSGCNTMEGIGEDVEAAGDKIDRTAEEKKNY